MTLTIYTQHNTYRFEEVENFDLTKAALEFDYVSASRGTKQHAIFTLNNIAGYSYGEE